MPRFLRSDTVRLLRLGKKRRKLQKWRRPKGRHSKIRKGRAGYPISPKIGYRSSSSISGVINGKMPLYVANLSDLDKVKKGSLIILSSRIGAKKKIEMLKKAHEKEIIIHNVRRGKK